MSFLDFEILEDSKFKAAYFAKRIFSFHYIFLIYIFIMMLCFTNVRNAQASFCIFRSFVKLIFLFPNTLLCVLDCYLVTYNYRAVAARTKLLVLQILCVRRISRYGVIHLLSRE